MTVLVDTSIWIDHFHQGDRRLVELLEKGVVVSHPFIPGEIACGRLRKRREVLDLLLGLEQLSKVDDRELLYFIERHQLMGKGLGLVDIHLLASIRLAGIQIWTRDKRLRQVAHEMKLASPAGGP